MRLAHKLVLGSLLLTSLIWGVAFYAIHASRRDMEESIGKNSRILASKVMDEVDRAIYAPIEEWRIFGASRVVQETLAQSNHQFAKMRDPQAYINSQDRQWMETPKYTITPFMSNLIDNELSKVLTNRLTALDQIKGYRVYGEVFLTNAYGVNVAASGKTTDYRQDDEPWWQLAKQDGVYVDPLTYDESSGTYSVALCTRIDDPSGSFVGVMKAVLNIEGVFAILRDRDRELSQVLGPQDTDGLVLLTAERKLVFPTSRSNPGLADGSAFLPADETLKPGYLHTFTRNDDNLGKVLASYSVSDGHGDYHGMGWVLIVQRPEQEIMAPVRELRASILSMSAGVTIVALIASLYFSYRISCRLAALSHAADEIGNGNLTVSINDPRSDEIGQLATCFDQMATDLNRYTDYMTRQALALEQHNALLQQEIKDRKQVESELIEANDRLRQAQMDLVQAEKMGMLGQIVAGVAHEINTPAGAILNVCADATDHLRQLVDLQPAVQQLPQDTREWLEGVLDRVLGDHTIRSEAGMRAQRREIESQLLAADVPESRRVAEIMVACGLANQAVDQDTLRHLSTETARSLLERTLALKIFAEISASSARKIARIVRALKSYSRADHGELAEIDVNDTIENTLVILENRIKHVARVNLHLDHNLPPVRSGPELCQVWTNVINNACDSIEESGGEEGAIDISTQLKNNTVVVEISNNGPPIPENIIEKIYEPFFTTKAVGKGTGLGLSMCTGILRRCGATISTRNELGRVVFEIALPAATDGQSLGQRSFYQPKTNRN